MTSTNRYNFLWKISTFIILTLLLATQLSVGWGFEENIPTTIKTHTSECILKIEKNEIDLALNIYKEMQDTNNYDALDTIIKQIFALNVNDLSKLLKFITKLPQCNHWYAGLESLFYTLQLHHWNTQGSFQFAYQLKQFLDENQCCLNDSSIKEKIIYLKYGIPEGIKNIIWQKSKLCIKNTQNKENLYIPVGGNYDNNRRRLLSWVPKGKIGPQGEFSFEPIKNASLFRIKSDYYREHLYAAACCKYDNNRRNVFTWIPKGDIGTQGEWALELMNESNIFKIRNTHFDEYLYAANCCFYSKDRRSIFTWIPKRDIGIQGEWEISSC